jgi:MEMO1 family protein
MKKFWLLLILVIIGGGVFWLADYEKRDKTMNSSELGKNQENQIVRQPAVAGQFYPSSKKELTEMIEQFLAGAELPSIKKPIQGLILPHAGYVYSGGTAAYGIRAIQDQLIDKVILIGPSHHQYLKGGIIDGSDAWQTPLGQVRLDTDLRESLVKENSLFAIDSSVHIPEHSLEVEIPFLQTALKEFKILPILINQLAQDELISISQTLAKHTGSKTLIIASSDMSHYPAYQEANAIDQRTIQTVLTGQVPELKKTINQIEAEEILNLDTCLCGQEAVEILMSIAQQKQVEEVKLLKYANSGDVAIGDKSRVVGYSAISFSWPEESTESPDFTLNQEQKGQLLEIAKTSVEKYILEGQVPDFKIADSLLNEPLGAFVTLKKQGQLRGCIGRFEPDIPLYQVVSQMAVSAAIHDGRFAPVQSDELEDLEYEISVLSPLEKIDDWHQIELGKHGVQIRQGFNLGVFLPQVATENNWDLDTFMGQLCSQKAGLDWDCWKSGEVDLYVFTAEVF